MRKNMMKTTVFWIAILLQFAILNKLFAQYSTTPAGIVVNAGGQQVELAVAKTAAFRISICYSGTPAAIPSIFIDTSDTSHAAYSSCFR